jgi:Arc/MetJ family transcription regulator
MPSRWNGDLKWLLQASNDAIFDASRTESMMRTTVNLDGLLLDEAQRLSGISERTMLIHEGLRALIERESARRLAKLGGTEKALRLPPRRRAG